jgi:hypothetical protein
MADFLGVRQDLLSLTGNPAHTSSAHHSKPKTASGQKSGVKLNWISLADQKGGSWGVLLVQSMSRVCPVWYQTTPREARQASWIRESYGKYLAAAGNNRKKAQQPRDEAILSPLLCFLCLFVAVLQLAHETCS